MILTTPSAKIDNRMEGVTVEAPKEKLGTPGFLRSIGQTILHKLSPKQFKKRPKLPEPTAAIEVDDSQTDSDEEDEEEDEDVDQTENEDDLDSRSFEEQREDWSKTKGKALARTPIQPQRLYPSLEEVEEAERRSKADAEDGDDESVDIAGPSNPIQRNRNRRVKGQLATRASTRLRGEPPALLENANIEENLGTRIRGETTPPLENEHFEVNVLVNQAETFIREQGNLSINNEGSTASSSVSESDEEEVSVKETNPIRKVEQKERVETRTKKESDREEVTVKIKNQIKRVEQKGKVETKTKLSPITPDRLSETNPFKTIGFFETKTPLPKMKEEEPGVTKEKPLTPHKSHFDKMYRYLRNAGASKEEAAHGAIMACEPLEEAPCDSVAEPEETVLAKDCPVKSNQGYYNSQKLLQNQQQQTISLLAQVPAFNGMGSTKFEDWIQHFERVIDTSEFEEGRKIKLLCSKLFGSAGDCITTFQLCYPKEAQSFTKVKHNLHERFHGGDSRKMYLTEYNNCTRNSGESIRDYACRIQKLYSFAYPTKAGKPVDLEMRELMIMDRFFGGLKSNLRERMSFKEFKNLKDLVKATETKRRIY